MVVLVYQADWDNSALLVLTTFPDGQRLDVLNTGQMPRANLRKTGTKIVRDSQSTNYYDMVICEVVR